MSFKKSPEENLVEDVNAARAAAEAEDPARTFLAEHRAELSEEQQKSLEWFATSEGEKALANFAQEKEEQKDIVRERAFDLLKVNPEGGFADRLAAFRWWALEKKKLLPGRDAKPYAETKEKALQEFNEELVPLLFKERIDEILSAKESFKKKISEVEEIQRAFSAGIYHITEYKSLYSARFPQHKEMKEAYFYGLLVPCLIGKSWPLVADVMAFSGGERGDVVNFDELVKKLGDRLSEGHSDEKFNKAMEEHNYVFNPKKNRYEKVEG